MQSVVPLVLWQDTWWSFPAFEGVWLPLYVISTLCRASSILPLLNFFVRGCKESDCSSCSGIPASVPGIGHASVANDLACTSAQDDTIQSMSHRRRVIHGPDAEQLLSSRNLQWAAGLCIVSSLAM